MLRTPRSKLIFSGTVGRAKGVWDFGLLIGGHVAWSLNVLESRHSFFWVGHLLNTPPFFGCDMVRSAFLFCFEGVACPMASPLDLLCRISRRQIHMAGEPGQWLGMSCFAAGIWCQSRLGSARLLRSAIMLDTFLFNGCLLPGGSQVHLGPRHRPIRTVRPIDIDPRMYWTWRWIKVSVPLRSTDLPLHRLISTSMDHQVWAPIFSRFMDG